jgi:hypothetical protein
MFVCGIACKLRAQLVGVAVEYPVFIGLISLRVVELYEDAWFFRKVF